MAGDLLIRVTRAACCGASECVRRAPLTFRLDERRKAVVAEAPGDSLQAIVDAARSCPNFAVQIWDEGRRVV